MTRVDKRNKPFTRYIGRGGVMGNPFTHLPLGHTKAAVQTATLEQSVKFFRRWANGEKTWDYQIPVHHRAALWDAIDTLKETDILDCYCAPAELCHGDVIIELWEASWRPGTRRQALKPASL